MKGIGEKEVIEKFRREGTLAISTNKGIPDIFSVIDDIPVWIEVKKDADVPLSIKQFHN